MFSAVITRDVTLVSTVCAWFAWCSPVTGPARVVDGDTIHIKTATGASPVTTRVRLYGIDAEELHMRHGYAARGALVDIIGPSHVTCVPMGTSHQRIIGKCSTATVPDIGAEMVRRGHALDCARYSGGAYRHLEPWHARTTLRAAPYC